VHEALGWDSHDFGLIQHSNASTAIQEELFDAGKLW